jgi:hypothetical protein
MKIEKIKEKIRRDKGSHKNKFAILSDKARKRRNIGIFRAFATQPGGMHRRLKCEVIFVRALSMKSAFMQKRKDIWIDERTRAKRGKINA